MKLLTSKRKILELKNVEVGFSEPCVLGMQNRVTFAKSGRTPKAKKLELVHTIVYGPTIVASLGESRYYVIFIDDSTRKVWVYFVKNKSDVFAILKKWKTEVENQTDLKVKSLMSDNGETPQQNGVAECMNRILNERAKNIRLHVGLPKMFWADAVRTTYLINRGPSSPLGFKIPEEEDKLDPKTKKCIFISYGSDDMGYRFWDEPTKNLEQPEKKEAVLEDITETDLAGNSGSSENVDDRAPVTPQTEMTTVRIVLGIVATEELHLEQLDVQTAFLHGDLEEDIYMVRSDGFQFDSSHIILLYVDDMLIAGSNMREINRLKRQISEEFEMKEMGAAKQILGMSIIRDRAEVGSLMYATVCTRPDIAHAVEVSIFMSNLGREHWEAVQWLLRYLKGTSKVALALSFSKKDVILEELFDADLGGCLDTRKSLKQFWIHGMSSFAYSHECLMDDLLVKNADIYAVFCF
ncbi:hypothetical protein AgCh_008946 [Apium graveolens]